MPDFKKEVVVRDDADKERIKLDATQSDIVVKNAGGDLRLHFDGVRAALYLGGKGNEGDLIVRDAANDERIKLDGGEGQIWVKDATGKERLRLEDAGSIVARDGDGNILFRFETSTGALYLGHRPANPNTPVDVDLFRERIKLDGAEGEISVKNTRGNKTLELEGAALFLGGKDAGGGSVIVRDNQNKHQVVLNGHDGMIWVKDPVSNNNAVQIDRTARVSVGCQGNDGDLVVHDKTNKQTIRLDGAKGEIHLGNADAAENFEVADPVEATPGTVMSLGQDGKLRPCSIAYDQTVVGVVSGADRYRPGLVFDRGETQDDSRMPISVMGKVVCRADARYGSIRVGDLLTTSPNPGCAMKASEPGRAFGTVIGKALDSLDAGEGLVPMLISLQ
ncbi:hypothetical protein SAMN04244553_0492 [Nocardia amikacinitolerans]|uniref:Uncharacterized protein n=1 Tax=Nocardia amikacinitolerans TaxID=756689 RepID=A0A285KW35_9NOCA|nr:hypothetical protein [Nocardia amikacinitolerans]MCP2275661.1 hypothetical protein [Nocardia amikacinitolerans]MCP2293916.1 hypothetical protein [Nocardia amikacinitolerans]SNY75431.1 hypothetical protein SAMN04244553_0492 [Nocardia amikacinitolerans]